MLSSSARSFCVAILGIQWLTAALISVTDDQYQSLMDFGLEEAHSRLATRGRLNGKSRWRRNVGAQFGASANSLNAAALVGWCRLLLRMSYREAVTDVAFA